MSSPDLAPNYRCATCGTPPCGCTDAGRRTPTPSSGSDAPVEHYGAGPHGPASFSDTPPSILPGDRDGAGNALPAPSGVNAVSARGFERIAAKVGPVATSPEAW